MWALRQFIYFGLCSAQLGRAHALQRICRDAKYTNLDVGNYFPDKLCVWTPKSYLVLHPGLLDSEQRQGAHPRRPSKARGHS